MPAKAYQPKRSSARWLEQAPEYILACYDNKGKTCDRYTVYFGGSLYDPEMGRTVAYLGMSDAPTHPQGFSQWSDAPAYIRPHSSEKVRWLDLPEHIRSHVIARATTD
ncbi:hypothetical protein LP414_27600 [Polaromonas sp. P1(28)-13]|nr:hypothetical protein LP414_27600 [Polaromonas sp. P1(28)-13]